MFLKTSSIAYFVVFWRLQFSPGVGYVCNVPWEWFRDLNGTRAHTALGTLWPNATVKYSFHQSLSSSDKAEVWRAFTEFQKKTCIRFEPRTDEDLDYTEISMDDSVCGIANVCREGGVQTAKFGQNCRTMATMIHELGHTLCLFHEQQRVDRDNYLKFDECGDEEIPPKETEGDELSLGIYDYGSQMHYECNFCDGGWPTAPGVTQCGETITPGLSLIDADNLNRIYNCQGCFRHRWVKMEHLSSQHRTQLHNFGYKDSFGALYPCRAFVNGEIAIGKYSRKKACCTVSHQGRAHELKNGVEVLIIPGGKVQRKATYGLVPSQGEQTFRIISKAIAGGRTSEREGTRTTYKAFATLKTGFMKREDSIGKVSVSEGKLDKALLAANKEEYSTDRYYILTCD